MRTSIMEMAQSGLHSEYRSAGCRQSAKQAVSSKLIVLGARVSALFLSIWHCTWEHTCAKQPRIFESDNTMGLFKLSS